MLYDECFGSCIVHDIIFHMFTCSQFATLPPRHVASAALTRYAHMPTDECAIQSHQLADNIDVWGRYGGFVAMLRVLSDDIQDEGEYEYFPSTWLLPTAAPDASPYALLDRFPPLSRAQAARRPGYVPIPVWLDRIRHILTIIDKIRLYLHSRFLAHLLPRLMYVIQARLLSMTRVGYTYAHDDVAGDVEPPFPGWIYLEDEVKSVDKTHVDGVCRLVRALIMQHQQNEMLYADGNAKETSKRDDV